MMALSTFENHCVEGKLTFDDPFLDAGVQNPPFENVAAPYLRVRILQGYLAHEKHPPPRTLQ